MIVKWMTMLTISENTTRAGNLTPTSQNIQRAEETNNNQLKHQES